VKRTLTLTLAFTLCTIVYSADTCSAKDVIVTFVNRTNSMAQLRITQVFGRGHRPGTKYITDVLPGRTSSIKVDAAKFRFKAAIKNPKTRRYVGKAHHITLKNRGNNLRFTLERTGKGTSFRLRRN